MMPRRRLLIVAGMLFIAALLAFPLRDTIYDAIIVPVAYLGWQAGLFYHSLSQAIWWLLMVALVAFMLAASLIPPLKPLRREEPKRKPKYGPVEDLAMWLGRAQGGVYYKWLIANRLGKLAYQILLQRESGRPRSVFAPLLGSDWKPSDKLRRYLETGLHGSFSDFPTPRNPMVEPQKTPLDHDVQDAVAFLEAQLDNDHLPQRL